MRTIILCLLFFMGIAVWADAKFILIQLNGIDRKKISVHRTLRDCLESGRRFQSIECTQVWKKPSREKQTLHVDELIRQHIMNVCDQEGK